MQHDYFRALATKNDSEHGIVKDNKYKVKWSNMIINGKTMVEMRNHFEGNYPDRTTSDHHNPAVYISEELMLRTMNLYGLETLPNKPENRSKIPA